MKNHWLYLKEKKQTIKEINKLLRKFVGMSVNPVDMLFILMRDEVIDFFKNGKGKDKLKFFTDGISPFDYNFEVDDRNGFVTKVVFTTDD